MREFMAMDVSETVKMTKNAQDELVRAKKFKTNFLNGDLIKITVTEENVENCSFTIGDRYDFKAIETQKKLKVKKKDDS